MANPNFSYKEIFEGNSGSGSGGGSGGIVIDATLTKTGQAADAKVTGDKINALEGKAVDKITRMDFAIGTTIFANVRADGIVWANNDAKAEIGQQTIYNIGESSHRIPLVAGDGIAFEVDQGDSVVVAKIDFTKINEYIDETFLNGAW